MIKISERIIAVEVEKGIEDVYMDDNILLWCNPNEGYEQDFLALPPDKTYKFLCLASDNIRHGFWDDEFDLYTELKSLDPSKEYALIEVQ